MKEIIQIWNGNRSTFGGGIEDWSNKKVGCFYLFLIALSSLIAGAVDRPSENFFNSVLTAVSVIGGFTFNALIFFVDKEFVINNNDDVLEQRSRQRKINRLSESSFLVIYYFNVLSVAIIICCICAVFMPSFKSYYFIGVEKYFWVSEYIGRTIFIFLMLEAGLTFFRALRRVRYLFGKVREASIGRI